MNRHFTLIKTRFKNLADYYSLVGAINELVSNNAKLETDNIAKKLVKFAKTVDNEAKRGKNKKATDYYEKVRAASNDVNPRRVRIAIIKDLLFN